MDRASLVRARLIALLALGTVLLLPPLLVVFNRPVRVLGIPALYLYIFAAWALIIALAAAISRRISSDDQAGAGGEAERDAAEGRPDA